MTARKSAILATGLRRSYGDNLVLDGTEIGSSWLVAIAWCTGLSLVGFLWARSAFDRDPTR
jgi:hypothetical protein